MVTYLGKSVSGSSCPQEALLLLPGRRPLNLLDISESWLQNIKFWLFFFLVKVLLLVRVNDSMVCVPHSSLTENKAVRRPTVTSCLTFHFITKGEKYFGQDYASNWQVGLTPCCWTAHPRECNHLQMLPLPCPSWISSGLGREWFWQILWVRALGSFVRCWESTDRGCETDSVSCWGH